MLILNILKWARISIGLSVDEVANKINKEKEYILSWELSEIHHQIYSQLEKLSLSNIQKTYCFIFLSRYCRRKRNPEIDLQNFTRCYK